jgi:Beta-propeller domains of methanol dehydrogenase type
MSRSEDMNFKTNGFQSSVNENNNELTLEDYKKMFTPSSKLKRQVSLFSAITLPLVLAACGGGGGGGGAVSPTPDSGGGSGSGGSTGGGSDSGGDSGGDSGSGGGSTDDRLQLNNKSVAATDGADVFVYDVSFDGGSVIGLDGNATITGFDPAADSIVFRAPSSVPSGFNGAALASSTGVDIVSSVIDGNTVIYLSPDSNGASSTITIEGVNDGDLSEIEILAEEGEADETVTGGDTTTDAVDLSSGTVDATNGNDVFEYTIKFVDGSHSCN